MLSARGIFVVVAKPLKVSSGAAIFGVEFKKPWQIFCMEVMQNAPYLLPWGSVNWQYRELAMASTRVKCIDQCTVRKKFSGHFSKMGFTIGGGLTVASVFWSDSEELHSHFTWLSPVRKWSGKKKFFKVMKGSGNFILSQGKLTM